MRHELRDIHMNSEHELVNKLHQAAIDHPQKNVRQILEKIGMTYNKYQNLIKVHLSIPQVRVSKFGSSRPALTQSEKDELVSRLKKGSKKTKPKKHLEYNKAGNGDAQIDDSETSEQEDERLKNMFHLK